MVELILEEEDIGLAVDDGLVVVEVVVDFLFLFDVNNIAALVVCLCLFVVVAVFESCTVVLLGKTIWTLLQEMGPACCCLYDTRYRCCSFVLYLDDLSVVPVGIYSTYAKAALLLTVQVCYIRIVCVCVCVFVFVFLWNAFRRRNNFRRAILSHLLADRRSVVRSKQDLLSLFPFPRRSGLVNTYCCLR